MTKQLQDDLKALAVDSNILITRLNDFVLEHGDDIHGWANGGIMMDVLVSQSNQTRIFSAAMGYWAEHALHEYTTSKDLTNKMSNFQSRLQEIVNSLSSTDVSLAAAFRDEAATYKRIQNRRNEWNNRKKKHKSKKDKKSDAAFTKFLESAGIQVIKDS